MVAELALMDLTERTLEIVLGDAEWAGIDTIAAADAPIRVVADDSGFRVLDHRGNRTGGNAGWVDTVEALALDEREAVCLAILFRDRAVHVGLYDIERLARQVLGGIPGARVPFRLVGIDLDRHVIDFLAAGNTGLAAHAQG